MKVPLNLSRVHVLQAIQDLESGVKTRWSNSLRYDLVHGGKILPPKAVLGRAIHLATGFKEDSINITGGDATNSILEKLGFTIQSKPFKSHVARMSTQANSAMNTSESC